MNKDHQFLKRLRGIFLGLSIGLLCIIGNNTVLAVEISQLMNLEVRPQSANKTQVVLEFSGSAVFPKSFSVENPPAIVFDFPSVKNKLSKLLSNQTLSDSILKKINVIETDAKTRVVIDMTQRSSFDAEVNGNVLTITFEDSMPRKNAQKKRGFNNAGYQITSIGFRRGKHGEGRLEVDLSTAKALIDFREENGKINVEFIGAAVRDSLIKRYDVIDFATPVQTVAVSKTGSSVEMQIDAIGNYDKIAYQLDNKFIVEVRNITKAEKDAFKELTGKYAGDKISLNFQDIEIRAILQIIADFSKFNIIASDSVKGNITLRLQNVPWDQALDIILKSEGLDKRQYGNVMLVGPAAEIASKEKVELDSQKQMEELGSVKSELVQINYASAEDLATLLKDKTNSLMTSRGTVSVDKRTNTLLIQDIPARLDEIKALLKKLDIAVRQVEISTQIVTADNTLASTLGMRFGGGANVGLGHRRLGVGSNIDRARAIGDFRNGVGQSGMPPSNATITNGNLVPTTLGPMVANSEGLFSDLGAKPIGGGAIATIGLALAKLPNGTLLDLELQAMEYESKSKTIARPNLVTMDQNKATMEKGVEIPYLESTSSGAASITFKTAALKLDVTPHITPDDKITLDLEISNDSQGDIITTGAGPTASSVPIINTNKLKTKVLVDNGETVALGGVLQVDDKKIISKVPFFGDLPIIGGLFRNKFSEHKPRELIIFLTPRIINPLLKEQRSRSSDYQSAKNNDCDVSCENKRVESNTCYIPPENECKDR
ncbi:MAG TPA: type IV pilus secretin PilQ [Gammaproteobacteria bacterium]|nr:type IV pilus secretin PilQ [Gammaproteobacteria bacterium]